MIAAGYDVVISNSRRPDTLADLIADLGSAGPGGQRPDEAAAAGDLVVVAIPVEAIEDVPVEPLTGKTVIDFQDYYPRRDGHVPGSCRRRETLASAELLQRHLPDAHVVKGFNPHHGPAHHSRRNSVGRRQPARAGDRR